MLKGLKRSLKLFDPAAWFHQPAQSLLQRHQRCCNEKFKCYGKDRKWLTLLGRRMKKWWWSLVRVSQRAPFWLSGHHKSQITWLSEVLVKVAAVFWRKSGGSASQTGWSVSLHFTLGEIRRKSVSLSYSTLGGGGDVIREKTDFNFIFSLHPVANGNNATQRH